MSKDTHQQRLNDLFISFSLHDKMVVKKLTLGFVNMLFPPLAVYMLCGVGQDLLINSMLFLLAVIPSHFHGFYISWTYFSRKKKVAKGRYPGDRKAIIYSEKVQNGGASSSEIKTLHRQKSKEKSYRKQQQSHSPGRVRRLLRRTLKRSHAHKVKDSRSESHGSGDAIVPQIHHTRSTRNSRMTARMSINSEPRSPPLPTRTWRNDIDGWLVRVDPDTRSDQTLD
jgi:uncharacterized membrane protein YqaE (UPF0057 family)